MWDGTASVRLGGADALGRRSDHLTRPEGLSAEAGTIQVVERAFEVLRCFGGYGERLANQDIAGRTKLPRSTVSRLTMTLTRIGQLTYVPSEQRYRLGPAALAFSTATLAGLSLRPALEELLRDFVTTTPGTVGFLVPDRFHMVYVSHARAWNAVGHPVASGTRVRMAPTAAGHAHAAALPVDRWAGLLRGMDRELPGDAELLRDAADADRRSLAERGFVVSCGLWSPHINGLAVPLGPVGDGGPFTVTIGTLAAEYDAARLQAEVGPRMLALAGSVRRLCEAADLRSDGAWREAS